MIKSGLSSSVSKGRLCVIAAISACTFACQSAVEPEFGMVEWYVANTTGTTMTVSIYDKVCGKNHFRVRIPRSSEVPISTCANEEGRAEIRYRRATGYSVTENPTRHDIVSSNQSLVVN